MLTVWYICHTTVLAANAEQALCSALEFCNCSVAQTNTSHDALCEGPKLFHTEPELMVNELVLS